MHAYPVTRQQAVYDEYHGVVVGDPYRWLEDPGDPAVQDWIEAQNRAARAYLDPLPARPHFLKRLKELYLNMSTVFYALTYRRGTLFVMKMQPPKQQAILVTYASPYDPGSEQVIVDPNQLDPSGGTAIDFYSPSLDGRYVAVSLSENGSEVGTMHVYDVSNGIELGDRVWKINSPTAGGSAAWNADGTGFFYTRYPRPGERPEEDLDFYQQVYFHRLGTVESEDSYEIGREFPRIAEIQLASSPDGAFVIANVANGDGGEYAQWMRGPSGAWTAITQFSDEVKDAGFGPNNSLYLLSRKEAPRGQVLRLAAGTTDLAQAEVVVPQSEAVITSVTPTTNRLYVIDLLGGPSQVRIFDCDGRNLGELPLLPVSAVNQVVRLEGDEILYQVSSFTSPSAWYCYQAGSGEPERTALYTQPPGDFSDIEVTREFATSRDGTQVPLNILRKRGIRLDGHNPTILYGYGGYGISMQPVFQVRRMAWLEQGGVYAIANLRGGGEYGEEWHRMGNLTRKQNVFDDFIGCAEHLIASGYTNPGQLAIEGGSNGGLLVGATLAQRPDLFKAAFAAVGVFDMLRTENGPNGEFNIPEFGTVKDHDLFEALHAYSPYHRIKDGVLYPAVLLYTGAHDGRVDPYQSRKMAARLQAATSSDLPILALTSSTSGHGMGTSFDELILEFADMYAFLSEQLGLTIKG